MVTHGAGAHAQGLLRLSQMDVHELARSHEDAERWLAALAGLHRREVRARSTS